MNQSRTYLFLITLLLIFGCGTGDNSQNESFDELPSAEDEKTEVQPVPLLVMTYSVESLQSWLSAFENDKSNRESFSLTDLGYLASSDDSHKISVILKASDHQKAREYVQSASLQQSLKEMGIIGEPEVNFLNALKLPESPVLQRYRMMITHEVKDYDQWKKVFDEHEAERGDAGLELIGIARDTENANIVSVMFAFEDMEAAKIFASSDELKNAMKEAGVISDPILTWLEKPASN